MARLTNPWSSLKGMPAESWVVFAATLINRAGTMVLPFLILYLTRKVGMTAGTAGLTLGAYGLGAIITAPLAGSLCDRLGPLRVMKVSLFAGGALLLAYPLLRGTPAILGATLLLSFVGEAFRPASSAIVVDLVEPARHRTAFALNRLAVNLGMSVGPAVGGLLVAVSFESLFVVDGLTSILAGVVLVAWPFDKEIHHKVETEESRARRGSWRSGGVSDPRLILLLVALIPTLMVFFQHVAAMPLFLVEHLGLPETAYGTLFTINTLLIILLEVPINAAMAGWPHPRSMALGCALVGLGYGAMALVSGYAGAAATVIVWTFGEMILLPGSAAWVAEMAPEGRRGEYMGLYMMAFSLAFMTGPWLGVRILESFGGGVVWGCALLCGLLSAAMMPAVGRTRR